MAYRESARPHDHTQPKRSAPLPTRPARRNANTLDEARRIIAECHDAGVKDVHFKSAASQEEVFRITHALREDLHLGSFAIPGGFYSTTS